MMAHSPDFQRAFQCSEKDAMRPKQQCTIY